MTKKQEYKTSMYIHKSTLAGLARIAHRHVEGFSNAHKVVQALIKLSDELEKIKTEAKK